MDHILVIDTDSYSGNFEREMTGWIVGHDNYGAVYDRGWSVRSKEDKPELATYFEEWTNFSSEYMFDEEYGSQMVGIVPTPGWSNNGTGVQTKLKAGEKMQWPAYQSVGIAISNPVMDSDFLNIVKMLAEEFAAMEKIVITGYRIITIQTVVTKEEIII